MSTSTTSSSNNNTINTTKQSCTRLLSSSSSSPSPIVELREYDLHVSKAVEYTKITTQKAPLRASLTPLRLFMLPETGGQLNVATHFYYFKGGFEERNERRAGMGTNDEWKEYLSQVRPCMKSQKSTIFVEAPLIKEFGLAGLSDVPELSSDDKDCIFEIRRYHLKLGYDTVPQFLSLYSTGLPSKLNAPNTDPTTSLVTLLYSEVGQLNEVIEVWRHGGGTSAMDRSRVAARGAQQWRDSIAEIANLANVFTSTIYKPLSFSPIR